ncbi:hypothetical protein [Paenibacillus sp. HB172176]|uniref:hypothetical protein n=1 Tax=Paenibacillus sp. HB172176 TaxID=2493690 RepID=UPI00143C1365|nr:hypothetical protein [Paenibacillus sp. HB172176]
MTKYIFVFLIITTLIICTSCTNENSGQLKKTGIASYIMVDEKGSNPNEDKYWIKTHDPNNEENLSIVIYIEDSNVWNLIELEKEYFAGYELLQDGSYVLENINLPVNVRG